jgi:hypothetical protein
MTSRKPNLPKDTLRGQQAPAAAIIPAPSVARGGMDYTPFLWQQLGDIQKSLGALHTAVEGLNETTAATKSKVQELLDLRNKFVGGLVVLGVLVTSASGLVVWAANKIWNTFGELAKPALAEAMRSQSDVAALGNSSSHPSQKP